MRFTATIITTAAAAAALMLPTSAAAATAAESCDVGITNSVSIVPPTNLVEGQTQNHTFDVGACSTQAKVTVEWVRVLVTTRFIRDASARQTILPEQTVSAPQDASGHMVGATRWTIPVGTPDGHYAVITRYYSTVQGTQSEQAAASSFSVVTPDVCPNIDGRQPSLPTEPTGLVIDAAGNCTVPPAPIVISDPPPLPDVCPNLEGSEAVVPNGYTLVAGECRIIAQPTGETPKPLLPNPIIRKVANVKVTQTGGKVRYTITTTNSGPGVLVAAMTCDKLPAGTTYVSHTGNGTFAANGTVCWKHGNMAKGKTVRMTLTVKVSGSFKGRTLTNTACVTSANAAKKCAKAIVKVKVIRREPVGGVTG